MVVRAGSPEGRRRASEIRSALKRAQKRTGRTAVVSRTTSSGTVFRSRGKIVATTAQTRQRAEQISREQRLTQQQTQTQSQLAVLSQARQKLSRGQRLNAGEIIVLSREANLTPAQTRSLAESQIPVTVVGTGGGGRITAGDIIRAQRQQALSPERTRQLALEAARRPVVAPQIARVRVPEITRLAPVAPGLVSIPTVAAIPPSEIQPALQPVGFRERILVGLGRRGEEAEIEAARRRARGEVLPAFRAGAVAFGFGAVRGVTGGIIAITQPIRTVRGLVSGVGQFVADPFGTGGRIGAAIRERPAFIAGEVFGGTLIGTATVRGARAIGRAVTGRRVRGVVPEVTVQETQLVRLTGPTRVIETEITRGIARAGRTQVPFRARGVEVVLVEEQLGAGRIREALAGGIEVTGPRLPPIQARTVTQRIIAPQVQAQETISRLVGRPRAEPTIQQTLTFPGARETARTFGVVTAGGRPEQFFLAGTQKIARIPSPIPRVPEITRADIFRTEALGVSARRFQETVGRQFQEIQIIPPERALALQRFRAARAPQPPTTQQLLQVPEAQLIARPVPRVLGVVRPQIEAAVLGLETQRITAATVGRLTVPRPVALGLPTLAAVTPRVPSAFAAPLEQPVQPLLVLPPEPISILPPITRVPPIAVVTPPGLAPTTQRLLQVPTTPITQTLPSLITLPTQVPTQIQRPSLSLRAILGVGTRFRAAQISLPVFRFAQPLEQVARQVSRVAQVRAFRAPIVPRAPLTRLLPPVRPSFFNSWESCYASLNVS